MSPLFPDKDKCDSTVDLKTASPMQGSQTNEQVVFSRLTFS